MNINQINAHQRDALIQFEAGPHKYTCAGEGNYISVTTWNHSHFKPFDADGIITKMMSNQARWIKSPYYGKTPEEIKAQWEKGRDEAACEGTAMHAAIEQWYLNGSQSNINNDASALPVHFKKFVAEHSGLKPYRTEWMIFNEDVRLAGSIDMVYEANDGSGSLLIYDWKRCKKIEKSNGFGEFALTECINHLPDTNFWHYALQLNTYKAILESKYSKKVARMCLVCLHPNLPSYQLIPVPDLSSEIAALFELRKQQI
jgi:hypothetical protein